VELAPQYYGRAAGRWPIWAIINRPELVFSMEEIQEVPMTEYGYRYKVLWVVIKTYTEKVSLQGWDWETDTPLWFQLGGEEPTTAPILDPLVPGAYSNADYVDFPSYVMFPETGCYVIEAAWGSESWQLYLTVEE
jgi:hypothetical protein